jgi:acyl-CoA reductase-like NAD-dependent aldehyde dehydrogenase
VRRHPADRRRVRQGFFIEPTLFGGVTPAMRIAQEEVFGPVLALMVAEDFEDAMRLANGVRFGLSAALISNDLSRVHQFVNRIEAGLITVNLPTAGVEYQLPSEARRNRASACANRDRSRSTSTRKAARCT